MPKFLHKFNTADEFKAAYNGEGYREPWVSYTRSGDTTVKSDVDVYIDDSDPDMIYPVGLTDETNVVLFPLDPYTFSDPFNSENGIITYVYDYDDYDETKVNQLKSDGKLLAEYPYFYSDSGCGVRTITYDSRQYFYLFHLDV